MELSQQQEVSSSSSSQPVNPSSSVSTSSELRPLRSSARVKAAKEKEKGKEHELPDQPTAAPDASRNSRNTISQNNPAKRPRVTSTGKGKSKESSEDSSPRSNKRARRATYPISSNALTIQEPPRDPKGKKRALPETISDEETQVASSSTYIANKRLKNTSAYSLRSRTDITLSEPLEMPKKTRTSAAKGKMAAVKSKALATGSSHVEDEDVEMLDEHINSDHGEGVARDEHDESEKPRQDVVEDDDDDDEEDDENRGDDNGADNESPEGGGGSGGLGGFDEGAAMAIFGDYRQLGSYMMGLSTRLKSLLNNIKPTADPTTRLVSLQELSELLSISTEDTLAGSFPVESYIRELVKILGGTGADDDDDGDDERHESDEDASLAAALALSNGGAAAFQGDENLEAQVLACRCLANLMEALPGVAHTVVYHGAIPVLCSKLIEISYIDLAEQTLSTLEKISEEFPSAIVREGGLAALLNYLDFFSIAVQRTALQAASNCCRNISPDHFSMVRSVWPTVRNCLGYSDQRLVEFSCLCVIRVIDSYYRASVENLESLVDIDLVRAVNLLLLPAGGSPLIASNTYTLLLRSLAVSARASSKITMTLLEADIVDTLYQILTGVLPSAAEEQEQGNSSSGQGLGGGLADMTVMQNLAHRPKDQVEEALSLISELMPPLPKDGVFDHKGYTEKALNKMIKAKAKADRVAARTAQKDSKENFAISSVQPPPGDLPLPPDVSMLTEGSSHETTNEGEEANVAVTSAKEVAPDRIELLRSKPQVVGRFMKLMVPVLIDVYAASVVTPVRLKTLTGLLKAVGFLEGENLKRVFTFVPVASFASSVLSSKDHPTLVLSALQLVETLLAKVPADYSPAFRREGVFHEIDTIAARPLAAKHKDKDKDARPDTQDDKDVSTSQTPEPFNPPSAASAPFFTSTPGYKKLSSLSIEPEDAITLRARVIRFRHISSGNELDDSLCDTLHKLVERLSDPIASENDLMDTLKELANLFSSPRTSISSFELLQSGVVDSLLSFTTDEGYSVSLKQRQDLLLEAFSLRKSWSPNNSPSPFAIFVKKLQESLTRMEPYEVVTVAQAGDDSRRSSPSLLARQLRLRLVSTDESDVPRSLNNIVVSIHAIATFQALHDYLRPRVSGLLSSSSRLSTMLAALTGAVSPPASTSRTVEPSALIDGNAASSSASAVEGSRRRSLRLSAKNSANEETDILVDQLSQAGPSTSADAVNETAAEAPISESAMSLTSNMEVAPSETLVNEEDQFAADFTDDEVDADVFEDELEGDRSVTEKTVTLAINDDGSKVEAQTPDGTRVATPNLSKEQPSASASRSAPAKTSYAAVLKAKPFDWHLEFSMDDHVLPLDLTIYGAIHQHEARKSPGTSISPNLIWQGVYSIKFKKVAGPPPSESRSEHGDLGSRSRSPAPSSASLPEDAPHAKILRLLRILHQINSVQRELGPSPDGKQAIAESAFVNNKLTAKLTRQLEEPMIVASSCLPDWSLDLPQHFPFLFPFSTRYNFLQSTSFGYARLILKWQSQQTRVQDNSRRDDGVGFLGRLQRQKVRISRKHVFESAVKVFELYGSSSSILEVEYFEEAGTGLGPTLEFYSLVSKEFARRDLKIWRDADATYPGIYVHHPMGLFPAPISPDDIATENGNKRIHIFRVIGQFIAKAMLDSRIIDLSLNKIFLKLVLGESVSLSLENLKLVDADLAASLEKLQKMGAPKCGEKIPTKIGVIESVNVEDLALDFTLPGYEIELRPGGRNIPVTGDNVSEYVEAVIDCVIGKGVHVQAKALREGFSKVFPISDLRTFTVDELVMLFGNSEEDWGVETLNEVLKADHGFTGESRAIQNLVQIMSEFDASTRRNYLQFITGSPKLPIGGFRGLNPALTVVRKPHEPPLTADDYLPSVMTCVNYLKLPDYSSKDTMREKLKLAMQEGIGSFHLS